MRRKRTVRLYLLLKAVWEIRRSEVQDTSNKRVQFNWDFFANERNKSVFVYSKVNGTYISLITDVNTPKFSGNLTIP